MNNSKTPFSGSINFAKLILRRKKFAENSQTMILIKIVIEGLSWNILLTRDQVANESAGILQRKKDFSSCKMQIN